MKVYYNPRTQALYVDFSRFDSDLTKLQNGSLEAILLKVVPDKKN